MALWKFEIEGNVVRMGNTRRKAIHPRGCNEPFKNRYWCPRKGWFSRTPCPFVNRRECENWQRMCGNI